MAVTNTSKKSNNKPRTLLKISKNMFASKVKKGASVDGSKKSSDNVKSSQDNTKKTADKPVNNAKKPKSDSVKDSSDKQLTRTDGEGKIKKRKLDKKTLAKRKLSRMKKLGYLTAPPRRSAALNASAIMNCIFDKPSTSLPASTTAVRDIKDEPEDEDDIDDTGDLEANIPSDLGEPQSKKSRVKSDKAENKLKQIASVKSKASKVSTKSGGSGKMKSGKGNVGSVAGGRRMASLNASAMMHATFGREERRARRDPLTIAIEASLRDMKESEEKQKEAASTSHVDDKTSSHRKSSSKVDIKNEKGVSSASSEKAKKRDNLDGKQLAEVTVKEEISSPTFTGSLEGLSEVDIRTKLIESAKIRSKISRQSSDEKLKKKAKRNLSGQQQSEKSKSGKIIIVNSHHLNCSTNSQSDY